MPGLKDAIDAVASNRFILVALLAFLAPQIVEAIVAGNQ
jgi:hypothetical protein